ncbi:MAG: sialidase family protein [Planctomycetota bacterium]|nr:sialidase family protein [Planctomycetota bacterium]
MPLAKPLDKTNLIIARASKANPRSSESTMAERRDGSILMIYQEYLPSPAGGEDNGLNQLVSLISRDGGLTWGDKRVRVTNNPGDVNVYSASLLRLPGPAGELLFVFFRYNVLEGGKPPQSSAYICRSSDDGETFSAPTLIYERQPISFASGVLKRLPSGRLIVPIGRQTGAIWHPTDHDTLGALLSDDDGKTWRVTKEFIDVPLRGAMEGHVEALKDGRVMMVMRTQIGAVFQSFSKDDGETWCKPQTTGLRQPETCPELIRLSTGELMILWCNAEYDPAFASHYGKRSPLTAAISRDEGATWTNVKNLADDPKTGYYNPVAFCTSRGRVVVAYTHTPYNAQWCMTNEDNHLGGAVFDVEWLTRD